MTVIDPTLLKAPLASASVDNTRNGWTPANTRNDAEAYGQGLFVGMVATVMAAQGGELIEALRVVERSPNFQKTNTRCIPAEWQHLFVFDDDRVVGLKH